MSQKSLTKLILGATLVLVIGVFVAPQLGLAALDTGVTLDGEVSPQEVVSLNPSTGGGSGGGSAVGSDFAISQELSFTTNHDNTSRLAISEEISITTQADNDPSHFAISGEVTAHILGEDANDTFAISGEVSATTQSDGGGGGGGGGDSGGGSGGSGGGGGGSGGGFTSPPPGRPCPIFLRQFIKLGGANDRLEVLKLQYFLNRFEGFNLPLTGLYTPTDFQAVGIFQTRYRSDILTPWGISDPTGYVFITTRLAINNIFCARATAHDLDLRDFYAALPPGILDGETPLPPSEGEVTTTATTTTSLLNLAAAGLLNFLQDLTLWPFLLFALGFILLAWRERQTEDLAEDYGDGFNETPPIPAATVGDVIAIDEPADEVLEETLPEGIFTEDDPSFGEAPTASLPLDREDETK